MKRAILFSFLISFYFNLPAQTLLDSLKVTGNSAHYLTNEDSIFISIGAYQEKVFYHNIAPQQTLFSLSKFYGLTIEELYFYNPELKNNTISIGQAIKIPIPNKSIIRFKSKAFDSSKLVPICYKVKKGDTVFNLSKRVFQMPVDTLMVRNNLTSFNISLGQTLQLGWMSVEGIPETNRKFRGHPIWKKNDAMRRRYNQNREVKKEHLERGVAFWQKENKKETKLYALHRSAPINSIIAVTNPMKKRTVYAKVIGRMPDSVYKENVIIVLSPSAAKLLGAKDGRFYVHLRYTK